MEKEDTPGKKSDLGTSIKLPDDDQKVSERTADIPKGQIRTLEFLKGDENAAVSFENGIQRLEFELDEDDSNQIAKEIADALEKVDLSKTEEKAATEFADTLEGMTPTAYIKDAEDLITLLGKDESKWLDKISDRYSEEEKELLSLTSLAIFQDLNDNVRKALRKAIESTSDILLHYLQTDSDRALSGYIKEIIPFYSHKPEGIPDADVNLVSVFKLQAELIIQGVAQEKDMKGELTLKDYPFLNALLNREFSDPRSDSMP
ncbi:MAG: hypothetical protein HN580_18900 [Deltaproteobacteria bacterium]|nr:hypothetical protein [Deltaproteobacteria bacterium]